MIRRGAVDLDGTRDYTKLHLQGLQCSTDVSRRSKCIVWALGVSSSYQLPIQCESCCICRKGNRPRSARDRDTVINKPIRAVPPRGAVDHLSSSQAHCPSRLWLTHSNDL